MSPAGPRTAARGDGRRHPVRRPGGRTTVDATPEQVEAGGRRGRRGRRRKPPPCPPHARAAALDHVSRRLAERAEEVARLITAENGKPLKWARVEVAPGGVDVPLGRRGGPPLLRRAAAPRHRPGGDRPDGAWSAASRAARSSGITPFNFPLNLVAHKVAPAIAVGAPIVVKPAPATPLSALLLGEILAETDLPRGHVLGAAGAQRPGRPRWSRTRACRSSRSPAPARSARRSERAVPHKHVTLELGGNAAARGLRGLVGRRGPDLRGASGSRRSPTTRPGRAASRCSGCSCTSGSTTASCPGSWPPWRRCAPATRPTRRPTSAR